jgi:hypothetical protein
MLKERVEMNKRIVLLAYTAMLLLSSTEVCLIFNLCYASGPLKVYVDPAVSVADPTEYFNISIRVENSPDIVGFQFKLRWDKDILGFPPGPPYPGDNALCNLTEGDFLSSAGSTTFTVMPNVVAECVSIGGYLTAPVPSPPNGNGTLANLRFIVQEAGATNLTLFDVNLYDYDTGEVVPGVTIQDGYFETIVPYVDFTWTPYPAPEVNEPATFDARACRPPEGKNITQYSWDFGDGNIGTGIVINHTYANYNDAGYRVNLTVTCDDGISMSKVKSLRMWHDIVATDIFVFLPWTGPGWPVYRTWVIRGEVAEILVSLVNLGTYIDTTNVTLTAHHLATSTTIALPWSWYENETATPWSETNVKETIEPYAGSGWDLMFYWNTTDAAPGVWNLTSVATQVPGEVSTDNNRWTFSVVIPPYGELSSTFLADGIIDILDVVIAAEAFGTRRDHRNWNPLADLNNDGIIDISDLVLIGVNFGKRW